MYRAIQNRSNLFFSTRVFVIIFLNILIRFPELNIDLKYLIHIGRVLIRGVEGSVIYINNKIWITKQTTKFKFISKPKTKFLKNLSNQFNFYQCIWFIMLQLFYNPRTYVFSFDEGLRYVFSTSKNRC